MISKSKYDSHNRLTESTTPIAGAYSADVPLGDTQLVTTYEYYADGSLQSTYKSGKIGHVEYLRDTFGRVTIETRHNAPHSDAILTRKYDAFGNLCSLTDPLGNETLYTYDALGRLKTDTTTGTRTYIHDAFGNVKQTTDRNGRSITYAYNALGQKISEQWSDGTLAEFAYTGLGEIKSAKGPYSEFDYSYDSYRQQHQVTQKLSYFSPTFPFQPSTTTVDFIYEHDLFGRPTQTEIQLDGLSDHVNKYDYDLAGRVIEITQGQGESVSKRITNEYDYATPDTTPGMPTLASNFVIATRRFDALTNLDAVAVGTLTTLNADQRVQSVQHLTGTANLDVDADIAVHALRYNRVGQISMYTDTDRRTFDYDAVAQLIEVTNLSTEQSTLFEYDENGNPLDAQIGPYNRLLDDGTLALRYDAEGNVVERWKPEMIRLSTPEDPYLSSPSLGWEPGIKYRVQFKDLLFNRRFWNDGNQFTIDAKVGDTPVTLKMAGGQELSVYSLGIQWTDGIGSPENLPENVYFEVATSIEGKLQLAFDYTGFTESAPIVDDDSRVFVHRPSELTTFEWDARNRLVSATRYHPNGHGDPVVFALPLGSGGGITLRPMWTVHYTYDVFDQLIARRKTDPQGNLVESERYVNESAHRVITLDDAGHVLRRQLWDRRIDQLLAVENFTYNGDTPTSQGVVWPLTDHQGSVKDLYKKDYNPVGDDWLSVTYDAFGVPDEAAMNSDGGGLLDEIATFYAGRELDSATGLYFNRARWYDPSGKRFLSEDPIYADINLYRYAGNNPTNATDPTGHFAITAGLLIWGGVSLLAAGTAGAYAANYEMDQAIEAGRENQWMINYDNIDHQRFERAQYLAAGSEVVAITGCAMIMTPPIMVGYAGVVGLAGTTLTNSTAILGGGYLLGKESYSIYNSWDCMSGPDRLRRVGSLVGPSLAGGLGGAGLMRNAAFRNTFYSTTLYAGLTRGSLLASASYSSNTAAQTAANQFANRAVARAVGKLAPKSRGAVYDAGRVPGPNPNNLRQRAVTSPTSGEGGVYLKPQNGRTKVGSTGDYRGRYGANAPDGIEVEIPQTRFGPAADDSAYRWSARRQRRFDEEYLARITPGNVRYRAPNPKSAVDPTKWDQYRHIFGYGDLPVNFGL